MRNLEDRAAAPLSLVEVQRKSDWVGGTAASVEAVLDSQHIDGEQRTSLDLAKNKELDTSIQRDDNDYGE